MKPLFFIPIFLFAIFACSKSNVGSLKCEMLTEPAAVDAAEPRLSWITESQKEFGSRQTAYRIQVATSEKLLEKDTPDFWDSGKVESPLSNNIKYEGTPLQEQRRYYWRVRIWDENDRASEWSKPSWWQTGIGMGGQGWQGEWIGTPRKWPEADSLMYGEWPAPLFRRDFTVSGKVEKAMLYISGLGYYEAYLNGAKVGDQELDPGWTDYDKRVYYSAFDVTKKLKKNGNCLAVLLGNGWYNPLPMRFWGRVDLREYLTVGEPCFISELYIEYADGRTETVRSDEQWKTTESHILKNNIYLGELVDNNLYKKEYYIAGFDDSAWESAIKAKRAPQGKLTAQPSPPIRATETISPTNITRRDDGSIIVDMGVNYAGTIDITLKGNKGDTVLLRYGELLYPDGSLNPMTSVAGQIKGSPTRYYGAGAPKLAVQQDQFVLSGEIDNFRPRFTFHGFQFIEITGYRGELKKAHITGIRLQSDVERAGTFECSDPFINKLHKTIDNTFRSNIFSVQSDCPHRERFNYGGDILTTCESYMMNYDMSTFYAKIVADYADAARPLGGLTETAPYVGIADEGLGDDSGPIGWGTVVPVLMEGLYRYYGDIELIREYYPTVKRWVEFIEANSPDNLVYAGIGDHESINEKPTPFTSSVFYFYNASAAARLATLAGETEDADRFSKLADDIRSAIITKFFDGNGSFANGNQTAQSFGLYFDIIDGYASYGPVLHKLLESIEKAGGHVETGLFATKYMPLVLSEYGWGQTAYDIITKEGFPGWKYMFDNGATSIWEHWAWSDNVFSHNHPMFGNIDEWFYKCVAGISPAQDAVAFDKIVIRPDYIKELTWAKASYRSTNGTISNSWSRKEGNFEMITTIPFNTTAEIFIPTSNSSSVKLEGIGAGNDYIHTGSRDIVYLPVRVGPGTYKFTSELK